jgi:hypothetical protein
MKVITAIILAVVLLAIPFGDAFTAVDLPGSAMLISSGPKVIPTFVIIAVEKDQWVEIQTDNFPPADHFIVTMGPMGSKGINGIIIGTTFSGPGGRFTMKYDIPPALKGSDQIAIRLESSTSGYFAYNWFYNRTVNAPGSTPTPPVNPPSGYTGHPIFNIASVDQGNTVTISPSNFPPNDKFDVRMNWMGTRGVAGAIIETVTTNANGKLSKTTFAIPDFLDVAYQIAIRLESPASGYYAYNWFYNNTTSQPPADPDKPSYVGYPTFAIAAVNRDKNVKIVPSNFPPNDTFYVRMNWMGTRGVGGTLVETVTSDSKGTLSDIKYPIPDYLKGQRQIAIRLESPNSGYYAFNWFYNNTYP